MILVSVYPTVTAAVERMKDHKQAVEQMGVGCSEVVWVDLCETQHPNVSHRRTTIEVECPQKLHFCSSAFLIHGTALGRGENPELVNVAFLVILAKNGWGSETARFIQKIWTKEQNFSPHGSRDRLVDFVYWCWLCCFAFKGSLALKHRFPHSRNRVSLVS